MQVFYIILGWLMGLLSKPIVLKIENIYRRRDLKIGISSELKHLVVILAARYYGLQTHLGIKDKSNLLWFKTMNEKYNKDIPEIALETIDKLLKTPELEYDELNRLLKANENMSLSLKKYSIPFIESVLEHMSIFDTEYQKNIFEIRSQISILNEDTEIAMFYYRLTFDPKCMDVNKDIINGNLNSVYNHIQERCRSLADKIDKTIL